MSEKSGSEKERVAALKRQLEYTDANIRLQLVEIVMDHLEVEHTVLTDDACLVTLGMDGLFAYEIFQDIIDTFDIDEAEIRTEFGHEIFDEDAFAIAAIDKAFKATLHFGKILAFIIRETDAHLLRVIREEDAERFSASSGVDSTPVVTP